MSRFLLDTNVVSSLSPLARPAPEVAAWLRARPDALWVTTISIAELASGVARLTRTGAVRKAGDLATWLDRFIHIYRDRILSLDLESGRLTGALLDRARGKGLEPGFADIAIAGIALRHDLTVATRNIRHFRPLEIGIFNPFESDGETSPG